MSAEQEYLQKIWKSVSDQKVPQKVEQAFQTQIVPMLKASNLRDPYIADATRALINSYCLLISAAILQKNAKSSEELQEIVCGVMKQKFILKETTIVTTAIGIVAFLVVVTFIAGTTIGATGSEWWAKGKIAKEQIVKTQSEMYESRLEFLKTVNKELMTCEKGKIVVQENGQKACFYEGGLGWFIEDIEKYMQEEIVIK